MSVTLEQINGHWYEVERDDQGNIVRKEARDPLPPPPEKEFTSGELNVLNAFLAKDPWDLNDITRALKLILRILKNQMRNLPKI